MHRKYSTAPAQGPWREGPPAFSQVKVAAVQDYWNRRPCNLLASPLEVGTKAYFDEVAARKYMVEPHIPGFAQFERWKDKRVLEIGCGMGTDTMSFAKAGARVTAVDLSERSLDLAKRRPEIEGVDVRFYQADAERLNEVVPADGYDLIYSFGAIHHTPHPERAVEEIRRYAGPQTTVKLMVYHKRSWKVASILLRQGKGAFWRLPRLVAQYSEAQEGCPVTYAYTSREARRLLSGFQIEDMRVDHIFPYRVDRYVEYGYAKSWYFSALPRPLFQWLERRFGWHLCITARVKP